MLTNDYQPCQEYGFKNFEIATTIMNAKAHAYRNLWKCTFQTRHFSSQRHVRKQRCPFHSELQLGGSSMLPPWLSRSDRAASWHWALSTAVPEQPLSPLAHVQPLNNNPIFYFNFPNPSNLLQESQFSKTLRVFLLWGFGNEGTK